MLSGNSEPPIDSLSCEPRERLLQMAGLGAHRVAIGQVGWRAGCAEIPYRMVAANLHGRGSLW